MIANSILSRLGHLPRPGMPERVPVALERWVEAAREAGQESFAQALIEDPTGKALLSAVFGNSPFLTECWLADPAFAASLVSDGPDRTFAEILATINEDLALGTDSDQVMRVLRRAKRRAALTIALADLGGLWPLERVTGALTDLAEAALDTAAGHMLAQALVARGQDVDAATLAAARGGLVVLGMGKLGARELNYSSDIDLIILFDPERVPGCVHDALGKRSLQEFYIRLARGIVRLLEERTIDGYVFRTDLRLRPDPASTPLALSVMAAETYYETVGQNWERAAMIKARPVAGDRIAGHMFLRHLRPFIWRRHLDFAAIEDIHSIKRQINAHRGGAELAVLGHNLKLGRGGIREIEFFAQTQQLIWGGRRPELRVSGTIAALDALVLADRLRRPVANALSQSYAFLREAEHRLQMIDDQQTHSLPVDPEALERFAIFMGYPGAPTFQAELLRRLGEVERYYAELFEEAPSLAGPGGNLVFTGIENDPETLETLAGLGFRDPAAVSETVRGWHHGRIRATRAVRARELLTQLVPALVEALGRTMDPDASFARFDRFLAALPAGVQLLSLFQQNPQVLELVAEIMGSAPGLAEYLGRRPTVLDAVLASPIEEDSPGPEELRQDLDHTLEQATAYEEALDLVRRWTGDRRFRVGVALLAGRLSPRQSAAHLSDMAEAVISGMLPLVEQEFAATHGIVPGGAFAVVALGKLGARELTPTSDLDLVFLYHARNADQSNGGKPLAVSLYYQRLAQRLISSLTALTAEGELFQVDMRLRPSGNKGPVANEFSGFLDYQRTEAWTWEHMALTRARVVAGTPEFRTRIRLAIRDVLAAPRDAAKLRSDIADMRRRTRKEKPGTGTLEIKDRSGGLVDIEFVTQYRLLLNAPVRPDLLTGNTVDALERLAGAGLMPALDAARLIRAAKLWQGLQTMMRLIGVRGTEPQDLPAAVQAVLVRTTGAVDFPGLVTDIAGAAEDAAALYRETFPTSEQEAAE